MKIFDRILGRKSAEGPSYDQIADMLDGRGSAQVAGVTVITEF